MIHEGNWRVQVYTLCCHGCGKLHDVQAAFLSLPVSIIAPDGNTYGCRACEDCMRDGDRVKRAYDAMQAGTFEEFKQDHWR